MKYDMADNQQGLQLSTAVESGEETRKDALLSSENTNMFLSLPDVVKDRLLSELASCGLRQLLKLRLLCKETKSWIDSCPSRRAKILFSKAEVRMKFNVETIERFLETPPPFHVPALHLNLTKLRDIHETGYFRLLPEEQLIFPFHAPLTLNPPVCVVPEDSLVMWKEFCDYWNPRLVSLQIGSELWDSSRWPKTNSEVAHVIRRLLDSPHLDKVSFGLFLSWEYLPPLPISFQQLSEISIYDQGHEESLLSQLYPTLGRNPNLKRVTMEFYWPEEFEFIHKIAEKNKKNSQFHLSLINMSEFCDYDRDLMPRFSTLVKTLVKCDFQTSLTIALGDVNGFVQEVTDQLGVGDCCRFLNFFEDLTVEYQVLWSPLTERTLENFENLKELTMETLQFETQLRFPPNLVKLTYGMGFPSIENLPVCLKELTLDYLSSGFEEFGESLTALGSQCVNLERLKLIWFWKENKEAEQTTTPKEAKKGSGDYTTKIKFQALKSLSLKGYSQNREIVRELLLNRLELDKMSLVHLAMSFHSLEMWRPYNRGNDKDMEPPTDPEILPLDNSFDDYDGFESYIHVHLEDLQYYEESFARGETRDNCPIHNVKHSCVRHNLLDLIDGEIMTRLCSGSIGKSLLFLEIPKETVTASLDGFPLLQKLKALVSGNLKNRVELEGRGPWFYDYPLHYDYYSG